MNDPLWNAKFGMWMGRFVQIWAKIDSNLRKFWKKSGDFAQNLGQLVYEWVTFSWKIGICMGILSNSVASHTYQNQTWVPLGWSSYRGGGGGSLHQWHSQGLLGWASEPPIQKTQMRKQMKKIWGKEKLQENEEKDWGNVLILAAHPGGRGWLWPWSSLTRE